VQKYFFLLNVVKTVQVADLVKKLAYGKKILKATVLSESACPFLRWLQFSADSI